MDKKGGQAKIFASDEGRNQFSPGLRGINFDLALIKN
jgi:hypothetical protein